jgi:membrane protease YdiL (CAAX protease family)
MCPDLSYAIAIYAFWTVWCILMVKQPSLFGEAALRAIVRVLVVLIPAVLYASGNRAILKDDFFLLRNNWKRGVFVGVSTVLAGWIVFFVSSSSTLRFQWPTGFAVWSNWILGSPLAEELFFRGVALREFLKSGGTTRAIFFSATLFAVLHLPWWIISGEKTGAALITGFFAMMAYGVVFAVLVTTTKSLWASLLPHWCNNFIAMATSA